uniref:Uncharacterized protein n=1 Tax=Siphoviridae sp. ctZHD14 TaxID=2827891 RepID=A0A8S5SWS2_9CAUD|nr:MAG TPA: hypothetical protein [Siphoviridae sp. ctZHD14]
MSTVDLIDNAEIVPVKNLMSYQVGYKTLNGVSRHFAPHQVINITAGELRELTYERGGLILLQNYLQVGNQKLAQEFGISSDMIEYNWTEKDVIDALTTSDIDILLDALDFAPDGIVEELKNKAIELEIADNNRIMAINKRLGVDISQIIKNKHVYDKTTDTDKAEQPKQRRSTTAKTTTTRRRTTKKVETEKKEVETQKETQKKETEE